MMTTLNEIPTLAAYKAADTIVDALVETPNEHLTGAEMKALCDALDVTGAVTVVLIGLREAFAVFHDGRYL